jgi:hypothetical protein
VFYGRNMGNEKASISAPRPSETEVERQRGCI